MIHPIKRGDVFYAELDPVTGSEEGGRRPVLIVQNDPGNLVSPTTIVAPITCRLKQGGQAMHVPLNSPWLYRGSIALTEQIRTIDKSRLRRFVCAISGDDMCMVEHAVHTSLGLKYNMEGEIP